MFFGRKLSIKSVRFYLSRSVDAIAVKANSFRTDINNHALVAFFISDRKAGFDQYVSDSRISPSTLLKPTLMKVLGEVTGA